MRAILILLALTCSASAHPSKRQLRDIRPIRRDFWHADCLDAGMSDEDYTLVLLQIVCLLMFSCGFMVLTHHPEWFGA